MRGSSQLKQFEANRVVPQAYEISALRTKLKMRQADLARLLDTHASTIDQWEDGKPMYNRCIPAFRRLQSVADHIAARRAKPNWKL
jgi:DNA-binding transcriptional regulator YiaG